MNFSCDFVKSHLPENQSGMNADTEPERAGANRRVRQQQPEYSNRHESTQDHPRIQKLFERVGQQFEAGIPADRDDLFFGWGQKMDDGKKCGNKDRRGNCGKSLSNQAKDCSSEQGFLDEGNGDGGQKYGRQVMPWKRTFQFTDIEPEKTDAQRGNGASGDQKTAKEMRYSPGIFAEAKILKSL